MDDKEKLSISQKISILNERQLAFKQQQDRFFSHIESEGRHFKTQGELIKSIEHNMMLQTKMLEKDIATNSELLKDLKERYNNHEQILINGGRGVVFKIDRLEQRAQQNKEGRAAMIATIGVVISILGFLIDYLQK